MDRIAIAANPSLLHPQSEQAMHGYIPMAMLALNGLALQSWLHGF
jgi:hypothetical protein